MEYVVWKLCECSIFAVKFRMFKNHNYCIQTILKQIIFWKAKNIDIIKFDSIYGLMNLKISRVIKNYIIIIISKIDAISFNDKKIHIPFLW